MQADVAFLVDRSIRTGSLSFSETGRDTGMSSNSIVAIAYGVEKLKDQYLPSDPSDALSCRNMWAKLPAHRKTKDAITAIKRGEKYVKAKFPDSTLFKTPFTP